MEFNRSSGQAGYLAGIYIRPDFLAGFPDVPLDNPAGYLARYLLTDIWLEYRAGNPARYLDGYSSRWISGRIFGTDLRLDFLAGFSDRISSRIMGQISGQIFLRDVLTRYSGMISGRISSWISGRISKHSIDFFGFSKLV